MNPEPTTRDLDRDMFRCAPMIRLPLGVSAELVYFPLQKVAHVLTPSAAGLLGACSRFASLAGHSEQILSQLSAGSAGVSQILTAFAEEGMMISRAELSDHLDALPCADDPPQISCLAIPTSDRPQELLRALASYAAHFSRTGRSMRCLVADDAPSLQANRLLKEALKERLKAWDGEIVYAGVEEKRHLVDLLAEKGSLPRDVLEFGLLGPSDYTPTMGANRNTIFLQTAGEMVLSVDDDTLCRPCAAPECEAGTLRLGSESDPTEFWFFPDRKSSLKFVRPADVNIAAAHEDLLGRQVWTLVEPSAINGQVDLSAACGHLLQNIWMGNGRVLITLNGSVGDSGMYSGRNLPIHKEPRTRGRLVRSEEDYRMALRSREVVRQVRSATVCHGSPIMTMFVGIDNRVLLPPFFPVCRNEDGTLGYMIERCLDGCYFGYLPWSLVHDPPQGRSYFGGFAATVRVSDLVIACISTWVCANRGADTAHRLRSLGRHLIEVASVAPEDFEEFVRMLLWRQAAQRISQKEALLRQYGEQPAFWAEDLRREIKTHQLAVVKPDYIVPIDLPQRLTGEKPVQEAQDLIRRYGELVYWWPAIVERATELASIRSAGVHACSMGA
jgi:hypothetical protein